MPPAILRLIGGVNTTLGKLAGSPKFMNYDKVRDVAAGSWACENKKLKQDTGFRLPMSLTQRLSQTARWYRNEGWLKPKTATNARRIPSAQHTRQGSSDPKMHVN